MSRALIGAGLAAAALTLSACGFTPLYGRPSAGSSVAADLSAIAVDPIPERAGQEVRNALIDLFSMGGTPEAAAYRLEVVLERRSEGLLIAGDASITRYNLVLSGRYKLTETATGNVVDTGSARAFASYNVVESQFATLSAEKDAESRAARELAQEIRLRLGVGFERRAQAAAVTP